MQLVSLRWLRVPVLLIVLVAAAGRGADAVATTSAPRNQAGLRFPQQASAPPRTIAPIPQVQDAIGLVDLDRLMGYVNDLSGEQPALVHGTPYTITTRSTLSGEPIQQAVQYMTERLERLGLQVSLHQWDSGFPPNIIAEKPGLDPASGIYILGAHLDSTVRRPADPLVLAPGADDNASGSAAVLMAAELLAPYSFDSTLRFALFTGEEQGLLGSAAYAASIANEDIRGMLNLDMIAWDSLDGPDMDLHARFTITGSVELANYFVDVVNAYDLNLMPEVYTYGTGASDHASFWAQGFPAVLAIEDYQPSGFNDFNPYYHTVNDRSLFLDQNFFAEMTKAAVATLAHLGGLHGDCYWADLDCSCQVDVLDVQTVAVRWGGQRGQWRYHVLYDLNADNRIDIADVQRFAAQWDWRCPS